MKTLTAIIGLLCMVASLVFPWLYDWRAGVAMLALEIAWIASSLKPFLEEKRERALLQRSLAIVEREFKGALADWRACDQKRREWKFHALLFICAFVVTWIIGYVCAWKLDKLTRNA